MSDEANRLLLRVILERLEPIVGPTPPRNGAWVGDKAGQRRLDEQWRSGRLALAQAVATARRALAEYEGEMLVFALAHCRALESGAAMQAMQHARMLRQRRAGAGRAAKQQQMAREAWAPFVEQYVALAAGRDRAGRLRARATVEREMRRAGFVDPRSRQYPDRKTIRRYLSDKKMGQ